MEELTLTFYLASSTPETPFPSASAPTRPFTRLTLVSGRLYDLNCVAREEADGANNGVGPPKRLVHDALPDCSVRYHGR